MGVKVYIVMLVSILVLTCFLSLNSANAEEQEHGSILSMVEWRIAPDKTDAYMEWVFGDNGAARLILATPGLVEHRGYDVLTGPYKLSSIVEFPDIASWANWRIHDDVQNVYSQLQNLASNIISELWGPSPIIPKPIKVGKAKTDGSRSVCQIGKWNILPGKEEAYENWCKVTIPELLKTPGIVEFRSYRCIFGTYETLMIIEFADQADWAIWRSNEKVQKITDELRTYTSELNIELWRHVLTHRPEK